MDKDKLFLELYKRLDYDAVKGELRRKCTTQGILAGALVGAVDGNGRLQAKFLGKRHQVDALIWFMEKGVYPNKGLKHINGCMLDNRIGNLFELSMYNELHKPLTLQKDKQREQQRYAFGVWRPRLKQTDEQKREVTRVYRENNRDLYRSAQRKYHNARVSDPVYRSMKACRQLLSRVIKSCKQDKMERTEHILGYTFEQFQQHIESLFISGMSWSNHGEWHVDHIKPVSLFIAEGITDPAIINALDNLQPLPAIDNLIKGPRYCHR